MTRLKLGKTYSPFVKKILIMAIKVIKTNVTQPFCVRHHVNICFIALVPYVNTNTRKKKICTQVTLVKYGDKKLLVANPMAIKSFPSQMLQ